VQASSICPVADAALHESVLNAGAVTSVPVPLRAITIVPLDKELLVTVSFPVATPEAVGANCTFKL
jgi:hypothetical protein